MATRANEITFLIPGQPQAGNAGQPYFAATANVAVGTRSAVASPISVGTLKSSVHVGLQRGVPGIFDRAGTGRPPDRPARRAADKAARLRILVELGECLPVTAIGYVLATAMGRFFLNERVTPERWMGTLLIFAGAALVSSTSQKTHE